MELPWRDAKSRMHRKERGKNIKFPSERKFTVLRRGEEKGNVARYRGGGPAPSREGGGRKVARLKEKGGKKR